jgi:L-fuculose-phosphate aldolase
VSLRSNDHVLITRGGAELVALDPQDCVEVDLSGRVVSEGHAAGSRPSSELPLHLAIYTATDARAIVHTHSHYATVLSTLVDELPAVHYAIHRFGGPVRVARYETFGTDELAASVIEALEGRRAALMANHGAVVAGRDIEGAVSMAIQLEWLASIYYHAILCGSPSILSDDELDAVRDRVRKLKTGYNIEAGAR